MNSVKLKMIWILIIIWEIIKSTISHSTIKAYPMNSSTYTKTIIKSTIRNNSIYTRPENNSIVRTRITLMIKITTYYRRYSIIIEITAVIEITVGYNTIITIIQIKHLIIIFRWTVHKTTTRNNNIITIVQINDTTRSFRRTVHKTTIRHNPIITTTINSTTQITFSINKNHIFKYYISTSDKKNPWSVITIQNSSITMNSHVTINHYSLYELIIRCWIEYICTVQINITIIIAINNIV